MQKQMVWCVILVLILGTFACDPDPRPTRPSDPDNPLLKRTKFGLIEGVEDDFDTYSWRKVPFAAPPVGDNRWRAPQDPPAWRNVLETKEFGDICPQYVTDASGQSSIQGSEDCLYLNIWKPKEETTEALPVYVWIHGGGNSIQMPFNSDLKGAKLAHMSDMVVVNFNYRLGPLGWFNHPALKNGDAEDDSGNYGTLDIIKVLQWVKDNIRRFGGDPRNVTIAGESAGGIDVLSMMISEKAKGLFHKAISESGGPMTATMASAEEHANMLLSKLLVEDGLIADEDELADYIDTTSPKDVRKYLRSKSAEEFLQCYDAGQGGMVAAPNVLTDGTVIPADGYEGFNTGKYANKVPLIIGANTYEAKLFLYPNPAFESVRTGEASPYLIEKYGDVTPEILDRQAELYGLVTKYASDLIITSGVDGVARKLAKIRMQPPVYAYQFNWGAAQAPGEGVIPEPLGYLVGACHGLEIDFFFGLAVEEGAQWSDMLSGAYTAENRAGRESLTHAVAQYISSFARTGNPNPPDSDLPEWKPWTNGSKESPKRIILDADLNSHTIEMSTEGKNLLNLMKALRAEPRYDEIQEFMATFQAAFGGE